ncbi:MAG: hypothetical protein WC842_04360 [Candidatus Paceibacterota bacterium]|jgi:hypothetical protein
MKSFISFLFQFPLILSFSTNSLTGGGRKFVSGEREKTQEPAQSEDELQKLIKSSSTQFHRLVAEFQNLDRLMDQVLVKLKELKGKQS